MASDPAEENRKLVPIAQFVTSSSPHGATAVMDVFIEPSKLDEYVKMVTPATREIRKFAENLFCEISVDPTDQGHIRVLHGWTRDSAWIREVSSRRGVSSSRSNLGS